MVINNLKFRKIALYTSLSSKKTLELSKQVCEILESQNCKILYDESFRPLRINSKNIYSSDYIKRNADLIIAIGGDGSMLGCSREYGTKGIPVLGINLGKLGFLTDIAPNELTIKLLEVLEGEFVYDERFFLETKIKGSQKKDLSLNEVVVHSGAIAKLIEFDLFINDSFVFRQKADGIIISSPTGSTAYSLSAGGPIVHPSLDAIVIVPMFPHSLSSSPLVVSSDSKVKIKILNKQDKCKVNFDSQNALDLKGLNEINICKTKSVLKLVHPLGHDFYSGCRDKLGWSSGIINPEEKDER